MAKLECKKVLKTFVGNLYLSRLNEDDEDDARLFRYTFIPKIAVCLSLSNTNNCASFPASLPSLYGRFAFADLFAKESDTLFKIIEEYLEEQFIEKGGWFVSYMKATSMHCIDKDSVDKFKTYISALRNVDDCYFVLNITTPPENKLYSYKVLFYRPILSLPLSVYGVSSLRDDQIRINTYLSEKDVEDPEVSDTVEESAPLPEPESNLQGADQCWHIQELSYLPIVKIKDPDYFFIVQEGTQRLCFQFSELEKLISQKANWRYGCVKEDWLSIYNEDNIVYDDKRSTWIIHLKAIPNGPTYVAIPFGVYGQLAHIPLKTLLLLIRDRPRVVHLITTDVVIPYSISWKNLYGPGYKEDHNSAQHCQKDSDIRLYDIQLSPATNNKIRKYDGMPNKFLKKRKSNSRKSNSRKSNSRKTNSRKSNSRKTNSRKSNSRKSNSRKSNSRKSNSRKSNSRKSNSRKSNSRKSNSRKSNSRKSNSRKSNSRKSKP